MITMWFPKNILWIFFLKKYVHFDVTPVSSPYDNALHLKKNKGSEYAQVIGSLNYLMNGSGPDIDMQWID